MPHRCTVTAYATSENPMFFNRIVEQIKNSVGKEIELREVWVHDQTFARADKGMD